MLSQSIKNSTIKGVDAHLVANVIDKLDKEFERLQKLEEKK